MSIVELRTFDNYFSANLLLTWFADKGIDCFLKDEHTVTIDPLLSNAIGGIKLVTHISFEKRARLLLKQYDEDYLKSVQCPLCGSNDVLLVTKQEPANWLVALLSWTFASYAVSVNNIYKCSNCGFESRDLPQPAELEL